MGYVTVKESKAQESSAEGGVEDFRLCKYACISCAILSKNSSETGLDSFGEGAATAFFFGGILVASSVDLSKRTSASSIASLKPVGGNYLMSKNSPESATTSRASSAATNVVPYRSNPVSFFHCNSVGVVSRMS